MPRNMFKSMSLSASFVCDCVSNLPSHVCKHFILIGHFRVPFQCQNECFAKPFINRLQVYFYTDQSHFHMKGFALRFVSETEPQGN